MNLVNLNNLFFRLFNRCGDIFFIVSLIPFWRKRLSGKVMVYLYHRIGEEGEHTFLDQGGSPVTSLAELNKDIAFLKHLGAKFIRVCDIKNIDFDDNEFYVVISFDDGFKSNYETVLETLDQQDIPSTIFQVSSMLQGNDLIWEHKLYFCGSHIKLSRLFWSKLQSLEPSLQRGDFAFVRKRFSAQKILELADSTLESFPTIQDEFSRLSQELYPSESQILSAHQQGHEIASHGHNHYFRDTINDEVFEQDLIKSQQILEVMGLKPSSFSYPFNRYIAKDEKVVSQYYESISTVNSGAVDAMTKLTAIPRNTWPGKARNNLRHRRWLLTGRL